MRRTSIVWSAALAVVALGVAAGPALASMTIAPPAAASATPGPCGTDYPPRQPAVEPGLVLASVSVVPGSGTSTITLSGSVAGGVYTGSLFSTVVELPSTTATSAGTLRFSDVAIPVAFQLRTLHHLDVYRACDLVGSFDFCVTGTGSMAPAATCSAVVPASTGHGSGSLPHTGWDHLFGVLRLAAIALATGAFLMYLRRRAVQRA